MRIKTSNGVIVHADKQIVTINGWDYSQDCRALKTDNKDNTATVTLVFTGKLL